MLCSCSLRVLDTSSIQASDCACSHAQQVQLMRANAMATPLLEEVDAELAQVWRFILEREVEAPERFQVGSSLKGFVYCSCPTYFAFPCY